MQSKISFVRIFLYFRIIVSGGLQGPITWGGIVTWAAHRTWRGGWICLLAFCASYGLRNGILFWCGARDKLLVEEFLHKIKGCVLIRVPGMEFARYFNLSFLLPTYIRPQRLLHYFARNRLHVFLVKRGTGIPPVSPCAYVSPISQDAYIFLRDSLEEMTDTVRFKITHEFGHAAGIFQSNAQRNAVGLKPVYFSILWVTLAASPSGWMIAWGLMQFLLAVMLISPTFRKWRKREHLNAELVADYMAVRHLPPDAIRDLLIRGTADRLVQPDEGLDTAETEERKAILADQFKRLSHGEAIDIPEVYMQESFSHPAKLVLFLVLHMAYIATACTLFPVSIVAPIVFAISFFLYLFFGVVYDAALREEIQRTVDASSRG